MADLIYGSEENYNYLKDKPIRNYLKYPSFRQQEKATLPEWVTDNFIECPERNILICPAGRELQFIENKDKRTAQVMNSMSMCIEVNPVIDVL
ncbi:MAG: hypothetical protein MK132_24090 [Lentisphaerales bacterium]|nr:hypothetical protein [Lentisphaerales bacterium]